jgi:peptidoglycan/LPS O-acetylase OafA/YrhL
MKRAEFPGFEGLRLVAAASVLFSHAFLIATGNENGEPFVRTLGPGNIIGLYGVYTFFIISGFLLARSLARESGPSVFAINRILRIYPGFVFCVIITAFLHWDPPVRH